MPTPGERFDRADGSQPLRSERAYYHPSEIVILPGWNGRDMNSPETLAHIATLEESILADGVRIAVRVKYDKTSGIKTLVSGQCRLTACLNLHAKGHTDILVPCERVSGDEAELIFDNLTTNTGLPLTQWEAGVEYRKLVRYGKSPQEIARRACRSVRYVNDAIALSEVPLEAKQMLSEGTVSAPRVLQEIKNHGDDAVNVLKKAVKTAPKDKDKPAKPLARSKAPSAKEKAVKVAVDALSIADELARMVIHDISTFDVLEAKAQDYLKARGIEL